MKNEPIRPTPVNHNTVATYIQDAVDIERRRYTLQRTIVSVQASISSILEESNMILKTSGVVVAMK